MNIEQLFRDYHIQYVTEGHKHTHEGWVHTSCPFCTGNPGYHLGYDIQGNKFVCWRCGGKFTPLVISKLLNKSIQEAYTILKQYSILIPQLKEKKRTPRLKAFKLPPNSEPLTQAHINYLIERKYDPEQLIKIWGLLGTGIYAKMDGVDYSRRIVIPYEWDKEIVSFDCRDITKKSKFKYLACGDVRELINHKHILYGKQQYWGDTGICTEGTTDVWRLGTSAFATSGIKYTPQQVRLIAKTFKRVPVVFDGGESQAIIQANKLVADLKFRGVDSFRVDIKGDPGGLEQSEADYLVKQLLK